MNENRSVKTDFDRALAENGIAQRAARAADFTAMREIVSDFVGWQEGHGPYQL